MKATVANKTTTKTAGKPIAPATMSSINGEVESALKWLQCHSTKATLDGMARYANPSDKANGVPMRDIKALGKELGHQQKLASALWDTGVYAARMLATFVRDKHVGDERFLKGLALVEREAGDERNFVKKAVNMALRAVGKRNRALNTAAVAVARRLAESNNDTARWVGRDALRKLTSAAVVKRLKA